VRDNGPSAAETRLPRFGCWSWKPRVEIRPPSNPAERRAALARLIDRAGLADPSAEERVKTLENYAAKRGLSLDHGLMVAQDDRIEAVCLCLDSPGRTANILLSPGLSQSCWRQVAIELLARLESSAASRNMQLLQGMVAEECAEESLVYAAAGFKYLANLLYLQSDTKLLHLPQTPPLDWLFYNQDTHSLFAQVIEGTYQDSLDCGSLNGVRHIEDILASHKATGQFDPQHWLIGLRNHEPVGVILLAYMEEHTCYEVVYMGCVPAWRGRGYGSSLLAQAFSLAAARNVFAVSVSVDEKNLPARKLYNSFGFREVMRRAVWIRPLAPSGGKQR
jgi:mycothiol synthase